MSVLWLEFSLTIAGIFIIISFSALHVEIGFLFFSCRAGVSLYPGVAKLGIALGSGPRGRGFKSRHSDHEKSLEPQWF